MEGGAGQGSHSVFLVKSVDWGTEFEEPFHAGGAAALDGLFEVVAKLVGVLLEGFGNVAGLIGDVEDEVVAEESVGILDLQEMESVGRKGVEFDGDGLCFTGGDGGANAASVDDDVGILRHVTGVDGHRFFSVGEDGEVLSSALHLERAEGPEGGLGEGESGARSMAGGEGAEEGFLLC